MTGLRHKLNYVLNTFVKHTPDLDTNGQRLITLEMHVTAVIALCLLYTIRPTQPMNYQTF